MAIQLTLPDPNFKRFVDGTDDASGTVGPGFASVKLTNDQKILVSRTNSQRLLARAVAGQKWNIDINYHPMTRAEFEPVFSFLLAKQGPLTPFFVSLPQYRTVQNAVFNTFVTSTDPWGLRVEGAVTAGKSTFLFQAVDYGGGFAPTPSQTASSHNGPTPGDMLTFNDSNDTTHTKAYLVTAVETRTNNQTENVDSSIELDQWRLTVSPPLVKNVANHAEIIFKQPKIKVVMPQPIREYNLNTDNLYSFNLKLEEYL